MLDLAEGFKDATQHVLCDVEVQRSNVKPHRSVRSLAKCAHGWHVTAGQTILFGLCGLYHDGDTKQSLSSEGDGLQSKSRKRVSKVKLQFQRVSGTYQGDRFRITKFNVTKTLESASLVASDKPHIAHL